MRRPRPADSIAADDANLTTEEVRECRGPRPLDDVPDSGPTVDVGLDGAVEADFVLDDRAVRERQAQLRGIGVRPGSDLDHLARCQLVDQATAGIDDVEAAVLGDPVGPEIDLVARLEPKASDRRDVEASDAWHGLMLPEATLAAAPTPPHIRKTPNRVSGIGACSAASIPIVRTLRVSSGSMTPSSHSRAVAK